MEYVHYSIIYNIGKPFIYSTTINYGEFILENLKYAYKIIARKFTETFSCDYFWAVAL